MHHSLNLKGSPPPCTALVLAIALVIVHSTASAQFDTTKRDKTDVNEKQATTTRIEREIKRYSSRLDLTTEQADSIRIIAMEARSEILSERMKKRRGSSGRQQVKTIIDRADRRIQRLLTTDQKPEYRKVRDEIVGALLENQTVPSRRR